MPQRILPLSALAVAAALGCAGAWALGFGPLRAVATMGQPLDASVVVRLQPGETLADNCVSAVVTSGDNLLPAGQVTATFVQTPGSEPRVRVRTSTRIEEPFINLLVTIGCESRVARQFTVFADPPPVALALDSNSALPALAGASSPLPGQPEAEKAPSVMAGGAAPPPRTQGRRSEGQIQRPARERGQTVIAVNRSRAAAVTVEPALPVPRADRDDSSNRVASGVIVRPEGVARLRLDSAVVMPQNDNPLLRASQQREEALQTAKIAVDVAEAANSSAAQKIAAMEEQLAAARKEVIEAKAALQRVQAQQAASSMAAASAAAAATTTAAALGSDDWLSGYSTWLAAGCGVLLLMCGGLYWRLRRSDAERLQGWMKDNSRFTRLSEFDTVAPLTEQFSDTEQTTLSPGLMPLPAGVKSAASAASKLISRPAPLSEAFDPPTVPMHDSIAAARAPLPTLAPLPPLAPFKPAGFSDAPSSSTVELDHSPAHQDISIEELLDVEQQAEFFVVLGQDDAAIDLLTNHVMSTGGASPMPYLKLLEIYRRIGDQTSYERTRKRFNARFNGVAPEWGADPNAGRSLLEYPEVLRRIEHSWGEPVDAMTELQTLMFRNDSNLLFELPAYRDIMMLFTLARDSQESSSNDQPAVDVLLPLSMQIPSASASLQSPQSPHTPLAAQAPGVDSGFGGLRLVLDEPTAAANSGIR